MADLKLLYSDVNGMTPLGIEGTKKIHGVLVPLIFQEVFTQVMMKNMICTLRLHKLKWYIM